MYLPPPTYLHTHFLTYKPAYLPIQFLPIYAFANPSFFVYLPVCLSVQSSAWLSLYLLASILSTFISCPLFPFSICSKPQATLPCTSTTAPHLLRHPPPIILPLQHSSTLYSHLPNKQTTLSVKAFPAIRVLVLCHPYSSTYAVFIPATHFDECARNTFLNLIPAKFMNSYTASQK